MSSIGDYVVPCLIAGVMLWGLVKRVNIFDAFLEGAAEGLRTALSIAPALVLLLTAVTMFQSSGAMGVFTWALAPLARAVGLPAEILPLALMRPLSGSGATVLFNQLLAQQGPDSFLGRVASVLMGSTETTFYTLAIYYGATRVKNTRHTLTASLAGDMTGVFMSVLTVSLFLAG